MRHLFTVSTALIGAAFAAVPALAQTSAQPGWSAQGRLEDGDSQDADERRYDEHRLQLEAGRRYRMSASSDDFDTVLSLYHPGTADPVAQNDDHGGSFNSQITFTAQAGGEHVLRVHAYSSEGRGAYTLASEGLPPLPPAAQISEGRPWSASARVEAMPADEMAEPPYSEHRLQLEAGRRYRFSAGSETEAVLRLVREEDESVVAETYGGPNSALSYAPTESGVYSLRIGSATGEAGVLSARGELLPPLPPPSNRPASGQAQLRWNLWQGELTTSDPDNNGQHFDDYLVRMQAGETRFIMVDAEGLDTMVAVLTLAGRAGEPMAMDDDSGPGVNPVLIFQAGEDGDYVVRVSSFGSGTTGAYRLRISDPVTPPLPAETPMESMMDVPSGD